MADDGWAERAAEVVLDLARLADAEGRTDLAGRLVRLTHSLGDAEASVAVVGGYQQGKSSVIAALLGDEVLPRGPAGTTAGLAVLRFGDDVAVTAGGRRTPCGLADLPASVTAAWDDHPLVTVEVPSPLLADGLVLVDTPGRPGFGGGAVAAALSALPVTDAVLLVTSATQPLTSSEVALATQIARGGRPVIAVATRSDLTAAWPAVVAADVDALRGAGGDVPVLAVSVPLRLDAVERGDAALDAESGFDRLVAWLDEQVLQPLEDVRRQRIEHEAAATLSTLRAKAESERVALAGGAPAAAALQELSTRARRVQQATARWGQELSDAMADLRSAVENDVRRRAVALLEQAERRIDEEDPAQAWAAYEGWLGEQLATSMAEHLAWRHERLSDAVARSAASFGDLLELATPATATTSGADTAPARLAAAPQRVSLGSSLYGVLRNSYGGLAMFGFFGGVAGVVLSPPVTVGIGLVLGGKGLRDERAKQLKQRRVAARTATRTYVDAAWTQFNADARQQLQGLQRALRDELGAAAERLREDTRQAYDAATAAAKTEQADRAWRTQVLTGQLEALQALQTRLSDLSAAVPA